MKERVINITGNGMPVTREITAKLSERLAGCGFKISETFDFEAELIVCIGGDGALLRMLAEYDFPKLPIVGINTGHLGFFQELDADDIDNFIESYLDGKYTVQTYRTAYANIYGAGREKLRRVRALNEIVIRGGSSHLAHLNIHIGDSFIETFRGDGIVISTPAGSTAYNYSLGGSIVDPRIELLQITPIAPINSSAYRSFTSGLLLPRELSVDILPEYPQSREIIVTVDGAEQTYSDLTEIEAGLSKDVVTLLRFKEYDFWKTAKQKLL